MYFPADPHTGILASTEDMDGVSGGKRPRLTPEERKERDRERTRRYRAMLSAERKNEIRNAQRHKVAERRNSFSEEKRNYVRMQNAKRARERRAERKSAMVLAGVHTQKPARRSRRATSNKRTRAVDAVRKATQGLFEPLAPTLGKARATRAKAAAAAVANNLSSHHVHTLGVGLPDSDGHLLEGLDMDEDIHNLPSLSATAGTNLLAGMVHAHHQVLHDDTDSEDESRVPRPAVLPMASLNLPANTQATRGKRRK